MTNDVQQPIVILGGGPAGLAAAYYAHREGLPVLLIEKEDEAGGLCRTFEFQGHRYDSGAHRLHDRDPEISRDLRALLGDRLHVVDRPSKIRLGRHFLDFPPTPASLLRSDQVFRLSKIAWELLQGRVRRKRVVSFADLAVQRFGKTLASSFLLNYTSKVWGLPAEELSPAVATRRLSGMSLRTLLTDLFTGGKGANHLDGRFLYPEGGYGEITRALFHSLPPGSTRLGAEVTGLDLAAGRITGVRIGDGRRLAVSSWVISTLPVTALVRQLGPEAVGEDAWRAAAALRFRDVRLIFLRLRLPRLSEYASIYIPDLRYRVSRVFEPKNRCESMAPSHETGVGVEVPCFPDDEVGRVPDADLADRVVDELSEVGLLRREDVIAWRHHRLANAYPVYALDFEDQLAAVLAGLARVDNLKLVGRNGVFRYGHLHDQMREAKRLIAELAAPAPAGAAPGGSHS
ncbi:MAG: FAD-dependent oxidoreductase [Acidobacteriota bacterium]